MVAPKVICAQLVDILLKLATEQAIALLTSKSFFKRYTVMQVLFNQYLLPDQSSACQKIISWAKGLPLDQTKRLYQGFRLDKMIINRTSESAISLLNVLGNCPEEQLLLFLNYKIRQYQNPVWEYLFGNYTDEPRVLIKIITDIDKPDVKVRLLGLLADTLTPEILFDLLVDRIRTSDSFFEIEPYNIMYHNAVHHIFQDIQSDVTVVEKLMEIATRFTDKQVALLFSWPLRSESYWTTTRDGSGPMNPPVTEKRQSVEEKKPIELLLENDKVNLALKIVMAALCRRPSFVSPLESNGWLKELTQGDPSLNIRLIELQSALIKENKELLKNNLGALVSWADIYYNDGIKAKAIELYEDAIKLGDAVAMTWRASMHEQGQGGPVDYVKAIELLERANQLEPSLTMINKPRIEMMRDLLKPPVQDSLKKSDLPKTTLSTSSSSIKEVKQALFFGKTEVKPSQPLAASANKDSNPVRPNGNKKKVKEQLAAPVAMGF